MAGEMAAAAEDVENQKSGLSESNFVWKLKNSIPVWEQRQNKVSVKPLYVCLESMWHLKHVGIGWELDTICLYYTGLSFGLH